MRHVARILTVFLLLVSAGLAMAQDLDKTSTAVEGFDRDLTQIAATLESARQDDAALVKLNERLRTLADDIVRAGVDLSPRLTEIRSRLDQLGPAPEDGSEPDTIKEQRAKLIQ